MRFIRAMHSCLCYHRSACSWTLYIFILCLSAQPFSGLVGEADSPSTKFTPAFCCGCNLLIYLKQRLSQYFGYVLALAFQPCPIWTVSWRLWSVLEGPLVAQCLRRFWKGVRRFQRKFLIIPAQDDSFFPYDLFGVSALVSTLLMVSPLVWRRFRRLLLVT